MLEYIAPDVLENKDKAMKTYSFEVDVFSIAMPCLQILLRKKKPFLNFYNKKIDIEKDNKRKKIQVTFKL